MHFCLYKWVEIWTSQPRDTTYLFASTFELRSELIYRKLSWTYSRCQPKRLFGKPFYDSSSSTLDFSKKFLSAIAFGLTSKQANRKQRWNCLASQPTNVFRQPLQYWKSTTLHFIKKYPSAPICGLISEHTHQTVCSRSPFKTKILQLFTST